MEIKYALLAFDALSQSVRLSVFRLLINAGERGMLAGEIGRQLEVLPNTLSTNLNVLVHAGLVSRLREGRAIRYFADFEGLRGLLSFLMKDCCGGQAELCESVISEVACPS